MQVVHAFAEISKNVLAAHVQELSTELHDPEADE
jgi:hypothetical protein